MGRDRHRLDILSCLGATVFAACTGVEHDAPPTWTPLSEFNGQLFPEVEQVALAPVPSRALRVVSYNVYRGVDVEEDTDYFVEDWDLLGADVIALQETIRPLEEISDAGRFARRLQMGHVFVPTWDSEDALHGLALLSRFPLLDIQVMQLHPQTASDTVEPAARAALKATVETAAGPVEIINVHLDVTLNIPERILQLRPAVIDLAGPVAVLGDFNTNDYVWFSEAAPILPLDAVAATSQAEALDKYMRAIGFATPTAGFGPTWGGFPEDQRLDSVFTRGLTTGNGAVERECDYSDHWPIWLDIQVRP